MVDLEKAYQESLDYIHSFVDYSIKRNLRNADRNFKIDRMTRFMHLLKDPQLNYPVIHVAGTKGKGSVSAMCASVLQEAGYKVGLYTSPHMEEFSERIQVNGEHITKEAMARIIAKLKVAVLDVPDITTFELVTALGFLYFDEVGVDIAVIEVGLGGRLDATNIVDPLVSVITTISFDHTQVLGNTLSKIAFEKGGIIKQGKYVVISPQKREAQKTLLKLCKERSAPVTLVGKDILFAADNHSLDGQSFFVWSPDEQAQVNEFVNSGGEMEWSPLRLKIPLLGYHQVINAATAYAALQKVNESGMKVSVQSIQKGFAKTYWPGRFELLRKQPPVVIDSAHNGDSFLRLRLTIDDYFPNKPVILVFGVSADKDIAGMLEEMIPRVRKVITTQSIHPRALDANLLLAKVQKYGIPCVAIVPIEAALETALEEASDDVVVVAAGSVFIAAATRAVWPTIKK